MPSESDRHWLKQPPLWVGAGPCWCFLVMAAVDLKLATAFTEGGKAIISNWLGSTWQWMVALLFLIAAALAISPVRRLKLGGAEAKPSLKLFDWCAVLICTLLAGGGVFWSAAEPLFHFQSPAPYFEGVSGSTEAAVDPALAVSFLHWGFWPGRWWPPRSPSPFRCWSAAVNPCGPAVCWSPWCLAVGWMGPSAISAMVSRLWRPSPAPSAPGFLSLQLSNAAGQLPGLADSAGLQSLVVVLLTAVFATSTVSGIQKGIKWLSELNVWLTLGLGAALLVLGPGVWLAQHFFSSFGLYLSRLPQMALASNDGSSNWVNGWTVFYWGWFWATPADGAVHRASEPRAQRARAGAGGGDSVPAGHQHLVHLAGGAASIWSWPIKAPSPDRWRRAVLLRLCWRSSPSCPWPGC